jgi:hypothetical protein
MLAVIGRGQARAQLAPEMIERGKQATALLEVTLAKGTATGSAFCVDEAGLYVTNAHVVSDAVDEAGAVRLVLGIGSQAERVVPARVLRHDDRLDLALLEAEQGPHLAVLELGQEANIKALAHVFTFGYPLGIAAAVGGARYPDITILPSQITALKRVGGELVRLQFDNQLNPGNSGGPVLDGSGRVVGVAVATIRGAAVNLAIPVGQLAGFLKAPGVVFDHPEITYFNRARPLKWTIHLQPPTPRARLAEGLSVAATLSNGAGKPRTYLARPLGDGVFEATVTAAPHDPDWSVELIPQPVTVEWMREPLRFWVADEDVRGGGTRFMLSVMRRLRAGRPLRALESREAAAGRPLFRLGMATAKAGFKTETIDLNRAERLGVSARDRPRTQTILAVVEAKDGSRVLATVRDRTEIAPPPSIEAELRTNVGTVITPRPASAPTSYRAPVDSGLLKTGGVLDLDGMPRGGAASIRPAQGAIPAARLAAHEGEAAAPPCVRGLGGQISDVTVGGGGRYLLLTLNDDRKVAVFDANVADVVKTINLPTASAILAAGARKCLIAFPDERVVQCWNLDTLKRQGSTRPWPIDGRLKAMALGSDSDGPALCLWASEAASSSTPPETQFSFVDPDTLAVRTVGLIAASGSGGSISTTGGSFRLSATAWDYSERAHLRASAGGALFAIWPSARTLSVLGNALLVIEERLLMYHLWPGPDGRTVFSGTNGRLNADLQPADGARRVQPAPALVTIPSSDPSYYLTVSGLPDAVTGRGDYWSSRSKGTPAPEVTASVHAMGDGSRLLDIHGLDEMNLDVKDVDWMRVRKESYETDFTLDKRFLLIPQAHLFITIPWTNDRLVVRRLDIETALDRASGNYLLVTSAPFVSVRAGGTLEHRVTARSKQGAIEYALDSGPADLSVLPDGRLFWAVPQALAGEDVTAVIRVRDGSGQERSHELRIRVQ